MMIARVATALIAAQLTATPALAYTECTSTVSRVFTGQGMSVWIALASGKNAYQGTATVDREAFISIATTALATGRTVTVRFEVDGLNCAYAESRGDLLSLWLN